MLIHPPSSTAGIAPPAFLYLCIALTLFTHLTSAFSINRESPLSYISPVLNVTINTPDNKVTPDSFFSLTIKLPHSNQYSNLHRRWVALSDPNAASKFKSLASYFPFLRQQLVLQDDNSRKTQHYKSHSSDSGGAYDFSQSYDDAYDSANKILGQFTWADGSPVKQEAYYSASLSSEKLLYYLTKNSSLAGVEYPQDTQVFKITLQPNVELSDTSSKVYTINDKGEMVPHPDFVQDEISKRNGEDFDNRAKVYKGTAYREVVSLNPSTGYLMTTYKRIGWARFLVSHDGQRPLVEGTWKVDDEEGLGIPPSIYHINSKNIFRSTIQNAATEDEEAIMAHENRLLDNLEENYGEEYTQMVVWRDADMHPTMFQNLDLLNDNYDRKGLPLLESWFSSNSKKLLKRSHSDTILLNNDKDINDPEFLFRYQMDYLKHVAGNKKHSALVPRSGDNNDTGDSGFSSGENLASTIGDTSGCPNPRLIALVGIAADCNFISSFNSSSSAREWLLSMVNSASEVYERQLNITLGISALVLVNETNCTTTPSDSSPTPWSYSCNTNASSAMNDRLNSFSRWRGERSDDGLAAWTLLTTCTQSSVVGLSWMGLLCNTGAGSGGVAGTNVVARTSFGWRVYAHEIGHTFGAVHDCTSDTCAQNLQASSQCCVLSKTTCDAGGQFIMNPASGANEDTFSQCTVGNICGSIGRNSVNSTCLTSNTGVKLVTSNECGNGIVEEGEECDCGGIEGCAGDPCCDPTTCKFTAGSECDDTNEQCCNNCKFSSSDTICRSSMGPCDFNITCPGNSSTCPPAQFKSNGDSCSLANSSFTDLTCISGHCTSRDLQCLTLLGNTTLVLNGNVVNVTRSCSDDSSCQLSCVDPSLGQVCIVTSQNFLDGTPCQGSGHCSLGRCIGGNGGSSGNGGGGFFGNPSDWLSHNTGTLVAIIVSIGAFLLLIVVASVFRRYWLRRRANQVYASQQRPKPQGPFNVPPTYPSAGVYSQRATHPPPPPPPTNRSRSMPAAESSPYGNNYSNFNYGGNSHAGYSLQPSAVTFNQPTVPFTPYSQPPPAPQAPALAATTGENYEMSTFQRSAGNRNRNNPFLQDDFSNSTLPSYPVPPPPPHYYGYK